MASLATVNTNDIGKVQGLSGNVTKLMNKVFPLTVSLSADKTVYAKGTTADVTITIKPMRDGRVVVPDSIKVNGTGTSVASTYTAKGVSATTKYTVTVTKDGVSASADLWVSFVNPTYYGVVSASATGTGDLSALTKDLSTGRKRTITLSPANQKIVIAYPKAFGAAASIKDANGFDYLASYTRSETKMGATGHEEDYYVYLLTNATTISGLSQTIA